MKKLNAFSMIELVFVIVVIGILAAAAIPRFNRDSVSEAAHQIVAHIRYTQHLAMLDDKFEPTDPVWYRKRWKLMFARTAETEQKHSYTIYADRTGTKGSGFPNPNEIAKDPKNPNKLLSGGYSGAFRYNDPKATASMRIGKAYGITGVEIGGGCTNGTTTIAFDGFGRPYGQISRADNPAEKVLVNPCTIKLTDGSGMSATITIEAETGYARVTEAPII